MPTDSPTTSADEGLRAAAQAVVDRWDTPAWKYQEPTAQAINRLRAALARPASVEPVDYIVNVPPAEGRDEFQTMVEAWRVTPVYPGNVRPAQAPAAGGEALYRLEGLVRYCCANPNVWAPGPHVTLKGLGDDIAAALRAQPAGSGEDEAEWTEAWIVDDEDGGPVGWLLELPNGDQVWTGDVAKATLAADPEASEHFDPAGLFVMVGRGSTTRVVAQVTNLDDSLVVARAFARQALAAAKDGVA